MRLFPSCARSRRGPRTAPPRARRRVCARKVVQTHPFGRGGVWSSEGSSAPLMWAATSGCCSQRRCSCPLNLLRCLYSHSEGVGYVLWGVPSPKKNFPLWATSLLCDTFVGRRGPGIWFTGLQPLVVVMACGPGGCCGSTAVVSGRNKAVLFWWAWAASSVLRNGGRAQYSFPRQ
jgi:hypothetical protein